MEHGQGIVGAEEQALMDLRVVAKLQQHPEAVGQRQGGDIRIEMRVALHQVLKGRQKLLIEHQSVAAGMGGNDRGAFVQRDAESIGVADRLIFPDQAELVPNVTQER